MHERAGDGDKGGAYQGIRRDAGAETEATYGCGMGQAGGKRK